MHIIPTIKKHVLWLSFLISFGAGLLIVCIYCTTHANFSYTQITLSDWIACFAGCATLGAFLYVLLDKTLSAKESDHLKRLSEIPFITLASPCDPTMAFCDINIINGVRTPYGRGYLYFSICNKGKINAYDLSVAFYKSQESHEQPFFQHYIDHLSPLLVFGGTNSTYEYFDNGADGRVSYPVFSQQTFYEYKEAVYSRYRVDPTTKEISHDEFDICGCLNRNCEIVPGRPSKREFFARLTYYSAYKKGWRYEIITEYKIHTTCVHMPKAGCPDEFDKHVSINGIVLLDYRYSFVNK